MHPLPSAPAFSPALAARLAAARSAVAPETIHARHRDDSGGPRYTNRLALESSPYLLGHAHNPVNWYPWGDEAFAEALRLGRPPIFVVGVVRHGRTDVHCIAEIIRQIRVDTIAFRAGFGKFTFPTNVRLA